MEQRRWYESLAALSLVAATCMTCYSLGWQRGHGASFPEYDRRLLEITRIATETGVRQSPGGEDPLEASPLE